MIKRTFIMAAALGLFFTVSGCIGIGVATLGEESRTTKIPSIGNSRFQVWSRMNHELPLTSSLLLKQWGPPDRRVQHMDQSEEWIYRSGSIWKGILLWAVIFPLPLAIPTDSNHVSFIVAEGQVVSAYEVWKKTEGKFFCGFLPTNIWVGGNMFVCESVKWIS